MARTAKEKVKDAERRGRTRDQIRCVAVARGDVELLAYLKELEIKEMLT